MNRREKNWKNSKTTNKNSMTIIIQIGWDTTASLKYKRVQLPLSVTGPFSGDKKAFTVV
jgi:hypothetical protein